MWLYFWQRVLVCLKPPPRQPCSPAVDNNGWRGCGCQQGARQRSGRGQRRLWPGGRCPWRAAESCLPCAAGCHPALCHWCWRPPRGCRDTSRGGWADPGRDSGRRWQGPFPRCCSAGVLVAVPGVQRGASACPSGTPAAGAAPIRAAGGWSCAPCGAELGACSRRSAGCCLVLTRCGPE